MVVLIIGLVTVSTRSPATEAFTISDLRMTASRGSDMKFIFEWQTNKFDDVQKNELEREIKQKVSAHLTQVVQSESEETLVFSLTECKTKGCLLKGEACCITKNGQKREKIKIKVDRGFLLHCENNSWFQPRSPSRNQ